MIWLITLIIFLYCLFLLWLIAGWEKLIPLPLASPDDIFISIIIPVRNEAGNIELLLTDLERQNYPKEKFEVLIIDDQSTDGTPSRVLDRKEQASIRIIMAELKNASPRSLSSKKAAITLGVELAKGDLIILTDGDARVNENWLDTYRKYFDIHYFKLIAGPVFVQSERSFFSKIQTVEFASLVGTGAALFSWRFPALCNGANLAFTREVFFEVDGYRGNEEVISGDDEFLLYKVKRKYPGRIGYLKCRKAVVTTPSSRNLNDFIQQRKRWAGKWKKHGNITNIFLALFIFFIHLCILTGFLLTLLGKVPVIIFLALFFVKILLEYRLINDIFTFAGKKMDKCAFFVCAILYSPYAVIFGILANIGSYTWKGRRYNH